jgi:hypothetical protein
MADSVLFLDIDGVLATAGAFRRRARHPIYRHILFAPECVAELNRITDSTGASIVVSSAWRIGPEERFRGVVDYLKDQGIKAPVLGRTPLLERRVGSIWLHRERGHEIQAWIDGSAHRGAFVIIDDEDDMVHLSDRLVQTSFETGLTAAHADKAIGILREVSRG